MSADLTDASFPPANDGKCLPLMVEKYSSCPTMSLFQWIKIFSAIKGVGIIDIVKAEDFSMTS